MKYCIKMSVLVLVISSLIYVYKTNHSSTIIAESIVVNNMIYLSDIPSTRYEEEKIVYQDLTLDELSAKIDIILNSNLSGYGSVIAQKSLDNGVDPYVATSIILVETGCYWNCSSLVKSKNNVGGMRSNGKYLSFSTLDEGIDAFIMNLANNYYNKGLNTPELINKKYAANPEWYKSVYYYIDLIEAS